MAIIFSIKIGKMAKSWALRVNLWHFFVVRNIWKDDDSNDEEEEEEEEASDSTDSEQEEKKVRSRRLPARR